MVDMKINTRKWLLVLDEVKCFFNEECENFIFVKTLHGKKKFKHIFLMLMCVLSFVCEQM
jgi:hypothetical protein